MDECLTVAPRSLRERYILWNHIQTELLKAIEAVLDAAGLKGADDSITADPAAKLLGDDHPAVRWLHTVGLGATYLDALAEREGWPSWGEDSGGSLETHQAEGLVLILSRRNPSEEGTTGDRRRRGPLAWVAGV
jgi:hypothetical protein